MSKEDLNYFSEKEKGSIGKLKDLRNRVFLPVSKVLRSLGFSANAISYIGFFVLIGFVYFFLIGDVKTSLVFLLLHVLIDAFDGPLARLMGEDGDAGAFTDIMCDHTGMVVVVATLAYMELVSPMWATIYAYIYTVMIVLVIVRNRLHSPIKFVVRSKYYLYVLVAVLGFWELNYLDYGLIVFSVLMLPAVLSSYFVIKRKL